MNNMNHSATPQISNLKELNNYLSILQNRINNLETENKHLLNTLQDLDTKSNDIIDVIRQRLPNTLLLSDNFFLRALTIWGHMFVIQFILSLVLFLCALAFGLTGMLSNFQIPGQ
ncbi:MAG TPA: hypothetical protein G4N95_07305 [Anaerolineae bacterium]|nr:hypothetical protein [Anaerolineae bacterium]